MSVFKKILKFLGLEVYTISLESFKEQFGNMMDLEWKEVKVKNPNGMINKYKTFPIEIIKCKNDDGKEVLLKIKPSIEMRITYSNNKKSVFYLDRIRVENNTVFGHQSRFFRFITKEIHFREISKIEIQDGKKQFKYV
jgi:hypothetical protein